ncbi:porin family protein [Sphingobacterium pedocola]|uniref:PorT family protein n=1 Tax=Sphingobacterium pedocola TaxID=2082722 RepID=A0ABR9TCS7_9SPHI|nr:porin family protein [Sphingobacterium pedocola]MBE8723134.1 PorT family protein [Sphingobacterium pedocola]
MKKLILAAIVCVLSVTYSQAQLLPSFKLGVKGALNFSSLHSEGKLFNSDTKTGYQLGVWGRVGIAGFHVQPEAYFASKRVGITENSEDGEGTFKSLDVPILLGTRIGLGPLGFRIQAGPVFSFAQDGEIKINNVTRWEDYKKSSTGIVGGLGVDVSSFTVDLRYEHGLTNIGQNATPDQKIRMWSIGVGYAFL